MRICFWIISQGNINSQQSKAVNSKNRSKECIPLTSQHKNSLYNYWFGWQKFRNVALYHIHSVYGENCKNISRLSEFNFTMPAIKKAKFSKISLNVNGWFVEHSCPASKYFFTFRIPGNKGFREQYRASRKYRNFIFTNSVQLLHHSIIPLHRFLLLIFTNSGNLQVNATFTKAFFSKLLFIAFYHFYK